MHAVYWISDPGVRFEDGVRKLQSLTAAAAGSIFYAAPEVAVNHRR
jgi:hypothetical protein